MSLIETADPAMGIGYSVKIGLLNLWAGDSLSVAEAEFEQATGNGLEQRS